MDAKIVQVALNGIQNILQLGEQEAKTTFGVNPYAVLVEECYGKFSLHNYLFAFIAQLHMKIFAFKVSLFITHTSKKRLNYKATFMRLSANISVR